jgi:hypothetical protein
MLQWSRAYKARCNLIGEDGYECLYKLQWSRAYKARCNSGQATDPLPATGFNGAVLIRHGVTLSGRVISPDGLRFNGAVLIRHSVTLSS